MLRILVTGGAGYVGSICAAQLIKRRHEVVVVDDLSTGHREAVPDGADFYRADIGDRAAISELLSRQRIDAVFHFAAKALIPESVTNPGSFFDKNLAAGIVFLECLRQAEIRNFVFSSTAAVYGNPISIPIREEDSKQPVNAYGESKLALERVLRWYCSAYDWTVFAFRYFNACGAIDCHGERHDPETHILPLLLEVASGRRASFDIFGTDYPTPDGTCWRDYVHVLDIAEAHLLALQRLNSPGFRAFNIGTGESHSVKEICDVVEQVTGQSLNIRVGSRRAGDPSVLCASPEAIQKEFGWKPRNSDLVQIVQSAWRWEQSRREAATTLAERSVVGSQR